MLMKAIDWWMVAIFFAIVVAIPLVTTFFNRGTSKDFLLAGRSMPWWLLGFSMTAACTSTDSANLFTEIIRKDGLATGSGGLFSSRASSPCSSTRSSGCGRA